MPLFTLDHARAGVQPIRQQITPGLFEAFAPPTLQYRYREKTPNGLAWSAWTDVPFVREEPTHDQKMDAFVAASEQQRV